MTVRASLASLEFRGTACLIQDDSHTPSVGCSYNVLGPETPWRNRALRPGPREGTACDTLTREAGQHRRGYNRFALLHRVAPLLDVVLEGHGRLIEAQGLAAVILEALEGRHSLHIQQRRLAVPGLQQGVRALEAVRAVLRGVTVPGLPWQRQPGANAESSRTVNCPGLPRGGGGPRRLGWGLQHPPLPDFSPGTHPLRQHPRQPHPPAAAARAGQVRPGRTEYYTAVNCLPHPTARLGLRHHEEHTTDTKENQR